MQSYNPRLQYGSTRNNKPEDVIDLHIANLKRLTSENLNNLLNSRDPNSAFEIRKLIEYIPAHYAIYHYSDLPNIQIAATLAIKALETIRYCGNNFAISLLTKDELEALLHIPAVVKTWDVITQFKPLQFMPDTAKQQALAALAEMNQVREAQIEELTQRISQLKSEKERNNLLQNAITKRQRLVAELPQIKRLMESINSGNFSCESNDRDYQQICKLIARSEDPKLTFEQAVTLGEKIQFHGLYLSELHSCQNNPDRFDDIFEKYGYKPEPITNPVPKYKYIEEQWKQLIWNSDVREVREPAFANICNTISQSQDPKLALRQAIRIGSELRQAVPHNQYATRDYINALIKCRDDEREFARHFGHRQENTFRGYTI